MSSLEIDELAQFLFQTNTCNAIIELRLGGIEDNKDLFYFCLDLFCKGLVLLFGNDNRIIVNNISLEQFQKVKTKMANAGINVCLTVENNNSLLEHHETDNTNVPNTNMPSDLLASALYPKLNMDHIETLPNNLNLTDYKFEINLSETTTYIISFELFHKWV